MTQNLRLGSSDKLTLTSKDSDISSDFILPESKECTTDYEPNVYIYEPYGGYYNWKAAYAGNVTSSSSHGSICSVNWKLPTKAEFQNLYRIYDSNSAGQLMINPANFDLAGNYQYYKPGEEGFSQVGQRTHYITGSYSYLLYLDAIGGGDSGNGSYMCMPIRCIKS